VCTYFEREGTWHAWQVPAIGIALALASVGKIQEGAALAQKIIAVGQAIHDDSLIASGHVSLAVVRWTSGDDAGVLSAAQNCVQAAEKSGLFQLTDTAYVLMAGAQSRQGQHEQATATLAQADRAVQALGGQPSNADFLMVVRAEVALNAGRYAEAVALAEQAQALALARVGVPGFAQRVWAQALAASDPAAWVEAEQHFAASLQALEPAGMSIEVANTHLAWGKALMQRGDAKVAREHLEQAAALYEKVGLTQRLDEARRLIAVLPAT
jgi:tetratricopeptide (TPR) repeat protein